MKVINILLKTRHIKPAGPEKLPPLDKHDPINKLKHLRTFFCGSRCGEPLSATSLRDELVKRYSLYLLY
jgi:hypothetical protein